MHREDIETGRDRIKSSKRGKCHIYRFNETSSPSTNQVK